MEDAYAAHASSSIGARKRREATEGGSSPIKRIKLEDEERPVANPNTIEAVREKNRAMALDLIEKNRRISFLTRKCESLFQQRAITESGFRCIQRQWLQLLDDLHTQAYDTKNSVHNDTWWDTVLKQMECLGVLRIAPETVKLELPDWFLSIVRNENEVILPVETSSSDKNATLLSPQLTLKEKEMEEEFKEQRKRVEDLLRSIYARSESENDESMQLQQLTIEKRQASASALALQDELASYKLKLIELQSDLEYKELERHRICREYDRLCEYMERTNQVVKTDNSENVKVENEKKRTVQNTSSKSVLPAQTNSIENDAEIKRLQSDLAIFNTKLQTERRNLDISRKEVDRLRASEQAWKNEEVQLKQEHDTTMARLQEEHRHVITELEFMRNKFKTLEEHVHTAWKEQLSTLQDESIKIKKHADEIVVKNAALREKMATYSSYRDQFNDLKAGIESAKREAANWKEKYNRQESKSLQMQSIIECGEITSLKENVVMLTSQNQELQEIISALKSGDETNALTAFHVKYEQLQSQYTNATTTIQTLERTIQELQSNEDAYKNENDALISEIETLTKEIESVRHSKKKVLHQLEEKRTSVKKIHTSLAKEVDAKAHCIEELAAARLQMSSLNHVHQQQKATINTQKELLQAKEAEVGALKQCIQTLEGEREITTSEKLKTQREVDILKQLHQSDKEQEKRGCDRCEMYRQKEAEYERMPATVKSNGTTSIEGNNSGNGLSDLERFELQDLQKQLKCSVCQDRHKEVVISKCYHMFCKECVDSNLRSRNRKCPTCKKMFGQDDVRNVWFT